MGREDFPIAGESPRVIPAWNSLEHGPVRTAARCIGQGGLVAYPTESFYGLAVDPFNETAIRHLFQAKRRQPGQPILLLTDSVESLQALVGDIPQAARVLMDAFWPGGLTLVFEAAERISPLLTANTGKIGLRISGHSLATALAAASGGAVTGTSANRSGQAPAQDAAQVGHILGGSVDIILDGGETRGGPGSTVLDVTHRPPRIIREGMISSDRLERVVRLG